MDEAGVALLLEHQEGVVSHAQVLACGGAHHDVRRKLRQRRWSWVHPGVYVDHTGPLTWQQRAWAAVLYAGPWSALDGQSALRAEHGPGWRNCSDDQAIRVAVDVRRTVKDVPGVRVRRVAGLQGKVRWSAGPPRLRVEEATLDLALSCDDEHDAFETLAGSVRARSTTAQRLLDALACRPRVRRRRWFVEVLTDMREGTCSVLERGYLTRVERAHGLPPGQRQRAERGSTGRRAYRDVTYPDQDTVVELDGRVHAEPGKRDDDLDRDLDLAAEQRVTLRLGWGQVFSRSCATAARVGAVLQARGWQGSATACGPQCALEKAA